MKCKNKKLKIKSQVIILENERKSKMIVKLLHIG